MNAPFYLISSSFFGKLRIPSTETVKEYRQFKSIRLMGKWISKKKSNVWLGWNLKLNGQECLSTLKQRRGQNYVVILSFILYKDPITPPPSLTYLILSAISLSFLSLSQLHLESGTFLFFFFWTSCLLLISIIVSLELCYMIWSSSLSYQVCIKYFFCYQKVGEGIRTQILHIIRTGQYY